MKKRTCPHCSSQRLWFIDLVPDPDIYSQSVSKWTCLDCQQFSIEDAVYTYNENFMMYGHTGDTLTLIPLPERFQQPVTCFRCGGQCDGNGACLNRDCSESALFGLPDLNQ